MLKICLLFLALLFGTLHMCLGQVFIKASDLFPDTIDKKGSGTLKIIQDPAIDTLLSRYILYKKFPKEPNGYRIAIYLGREKNAKNESNKICAEFMIQFPKIPYYIEFQEPTTYLVTVGNFRTKVEGTKLFMEIRKKYPDAFLIRQIINYLDMDNN